MSSASRPCAACSAWRPAVPWFFESNEIHRDLVGSSRCVLYSEGIEMMLRSNDLFGYGTVGMVGSYARRTSVGVDYVRAAALFTPTKSRSGLRSQPHVGSVLGSASPWMAGGTALVIMVQTTDVRHGDNRAGGAVNLTLVRRILPERQVRAPVVVVRGGRPGVKQSRREQRAFWQLTSRRGGAM
jgi:hypothetical protein